MRIFRSKPTLCFHSCTRRWFNYPIYHGVAEYTACRRRANGREIDGKNRFDFGWFSSMHEQSTNVNVKHWKIYLLHGESLLFTYVLFRSALFIWYCIASCCIEANVPFSSCCMRFLWDTFLSHNFLIPNIPPKQKVIVVCSYSIIIANNLSMSILLRQVCNQSCESTSRL